MECHCLSFFSECIGAILGIVGTYLCARYSANKDKELASNAANRQKKLIEEKEKEIELSNLICVITQLGGFVNYLQYFCKFNSAYDSNEYGGIVERIAHIDKNVLDISQQFFYNNNLHEEVKVKLYSFIENYVGWKGFKPLLYAETFNELNLIIDLQKDAIEVLDEILKCYDQEPQIINLISNIAVVRKEIYDQCNDDQKNMKYIGPNLLYLFNDRYVSAVLKRKFDLTIFGWDEIQKLIVAECFKHIISNNFHTVINFDAGKILFFEEIKATTFCANDFVKLETIEDKTIKANDMVMYLYNLVSSEYDKKLKLKTITNPKN